SAIILMDGPSGRNAKHAPARLGAAAPRRGRSVVLLGRVAQLWPEGPPSLKHSGAASRLLADHPLEGREELVHVGLRHGQGAAAEAPLRQADAFVQKTHEGAERALRIRGAARAIVAEPLLGPVNPEERAQSRHLRGLL